MSNGKDVTWDEFQAVKALAKLAKSTALNAAQQSDARNEILLTLGAIDGYTDCRGIERQSLSYALKYGVLSKDAPSV
ncbi:hypothetical protein [Burkholderia cepacia]|uniref:hypothetical protein n=1 Tax=Burkholderia cepacia TaxID=292 RepID=UPI002FE24DDB